MKRAWKILVMTFGITESARSRARRQLERPMMPHPTGVCMGCGVDLFDGTYFCSGKCKAFYLEYMSSYGEQ